MSDIRFLAGVALAALTAATAATAQTAAPATPVQTAEAEDAGEIVVTARKREERLQDVPLTISVVGAEAIERAKLGNISDLAMQTPGFSYKQAFGRIGGGGGAGVRPSVRGMSSVVGAPNAAFFVDGVFVSDNIASYQLDNLERVEVIKGPQSALFGRQTFAGAINYVTRKPSETFTGRAKLTVAEYNEIEASGYVSGPIVEDLLFFELNGRHYKFGGDYVNSDTGKRDLGAQRSNNVGARLLFKPTPNFEALASFGIGDDRDKGYVYNPQGSLRNNCFAPPIVATIPFPRTNTNRRGFFCGEVKTLNSYAYNNDAIEALGYNGLDRRFVRSSLSLKYEGDGGWSAISITAANSNRSITGQDNTLAPSANPSIAIDGERNRDFSQEVKLLSPANAPVRGLIGGYYYKENRGEGFSLNTATNQQRPFDSDDGVRSKSVFGMIEADVSERITVGAEARYQKEKIIGSSEPLGIPGSVPPPPVAVLGSPLKFNAFLPRFTAKYQATDDLNVYATAAKGNKPGGFNSLPTDASAADNATFTAAGFTRFDEETAWSYELGVKGKLADLVNFSVAGFYTDWKKQQLSRGESYTRLNGTPNSVVFIQNAGESEIKGFEVDFSANPTDWLYLRLGYTYVDAKFKTFYDDTTEEIFDTDGRPSFRTDDTRNPLDVDGPTGDVSGNRLPQTPEHQAVFTAQVTAPVGGNGLEFVARGDLAYESKRFSQVDNLNWAGDSFNLNTTLSIENERWSLTLFARNLLNDKTPLVVTRILDFNRLLTRVNPLTGTNQTTFFRDFYVSAPRKRQFGVTGTVKF
jgi:outer membrane receptor protein involved in Fe transport